MEEIHQIIEALRVSDEKSVLATIIHVEGSSYRKEGTTMLFQENGIQIGTLSGGCLEADLALRAEDIMKNQDKYNQMFIFDMRDEDDLSWGQGAGCNGKIYVLLEPVDKKRRMDLFELKKVLDQQESVLFVHQLTDDFQGVNYCYFPENGKAFGTWMNGLDREGFKDRFSGIARIPEGKTPVYTHYYRPRPRLIIFGAGSDAKPLTFFAKKAGFTVIVADWRDALCNPSFFPDADQWIIGFPKEIMNKINFASNDFIVLMTHQFQRDQEILSLLHHKNLHYIGVLGSENRMKRLWGNKEMPASIRSPVGIPIGAEGPEEIAISIFADVIRTLRTAEHF